MPVGRSPSFILQTPRRWPKDASATHSRNQIITAICFTNCWNEKALIDLADENGVTEKQVLAAHRKDREWGLWDLLQN